MNKVIFLDRDGVINREIGNYVYNIKDFVINDGLEKALYNWSKNGYSFAIVTNQGGIAKGLYNRNDVEEINVFLRNWFEARSFNLLTILYCPHHDAIEHCICRKPNSLMLEKIIARYTVSLKHSFMIGDSDRDVQAANNVGLRGFKIKANSNLNEFIL
tara:strand:- start:368 stop:841 length:474 start_codon:yes stop_codon:yes gene_type:complete